MRDASIYAKKGSPFWYCSYYCPDEMKRVHRATPWRVNDPTSKRHALAFAAAKSSAAGAFRGHAKKEVWSAWVPAFLSERYRPSPLSHVRAINAWTAINVFLENNRLALPAAVTYNHVIAYVPWRVTEMRACGKPISRNTAIVEIKFLGLIMQEAVRRGYCTNNPCDRLRIRRDPPKEKPELTDDEIALIRNECARIEGNRPIAEQWMTTSFEIALHTWCRLSSTSIPLNRIDFERRELTLRTKGRKIGEPSYLTVPIHDDLMPRLLALRAAGASHTCQLPKMAAKEWWALRQRLKIGHTCFHSTRVTGISRARRAGVPESFAMKLAGHKSETVHRIYQRSTTEDLAKQLNMVRFAPASTAIGEMPQTPDANPTRQ